MSGTTQQIDRDGRLLLPADFASCLVTIEREGDELRIRKVKPSRRRHSFKELMAGVTDDNLHAEIDTGPPVGGEAL